ncbi:MAG: response regulator [Myxococcota bacterium]
MSGATPVRVLLLEDEPTDADLVRRQLRRAKNATFAVEHVTMLADATHRVLSESFDAILSDLSVPDSGGIATVRRLASLAPNVPLVVMTVDDSHDTRIKVLRLGAQDFLPKAAMTSESLVRTLLFAVERDRHQARIRQLVAENADGCLVVDQDGQILFANPAAGRLLHRKPADLIGDRFPHPFQGETPAEIELNFSSHPRKYAELRAVEVDWEEGAAHLISIRDVTDRRRALELERRLLHADRLASIGQLAAGVAHEINNPATFIQANSASIVEGAASLRRAVADLSQVIAGELGDGDSTRAATILERSGLRKALREIEQLAEESVEGVRRISSTVRALSTFARIEEDEVAPTDINQLIDIALRMTGNQLRHRAGVELELATLPSLNVDRSRLTQVFVNLLLNSIDALGEAANQNRVGIRSRVVDDEVVVEVEDNGSGIPEPQLGQIFEPFFTTKQRDRGTGLGLSISAETVRKHGGRIAVRSELGVGTVFSVCLPLETGLTASVRPAADVPAAPGQRGRLLLVDDDALVRRALRRSILPFHDVEEADGGLRALELLETDSNFDVVLCDLMMPEIDGVEVHRRLSERAPDLASRMAFVTGGVFTPRARRFLATYAPVVIEKPVSPRRLLSIVHKLMADGDGELVG